MKRYAGFLLFALVLAMVGPVRATTVMPISVEDMTRTATNVVEGTALESWSAWNAEHTIIYTYTRFTVTRNLKGEPSPQVIVKQPGGIVGAYGQKVPGVRQFVPGEDSVLFLRPSNESDGTHAVVGLMQGNFRVYRRPNGEVHVSNGAPGVAELSAGGLRSYTGSTMSLQKLETRVQGAKGQ